MATFATKKRQRLEGLNEDLGEYKEFPTIIEKEKGPCRWNQIFENDCIREGWPRWNLPESLEKLCEDMTYRLENEQHCQLAITGWELGVGKSTFGTFLCWKFDSLFGFEDIIMSLKALGERASARDHDYFLMLDEPQTWGLRNWDWQRLNRVIAKFFETQRGKRMNVIHALPYYEELFITARNLCTWVLHLTYKCNSPDGGHAHGYLYEKSKRAFGVAYHIIGRITFPNPYSSGEQGLIEILNRYNEEKKQPLMNEVLDELYTEEVDEGTVVQYARDFLGWCQAKNLDVTKRGAVKKGFLWTLWAHERNLSSRLSDKDYENIWTVFTYLVAQNSNQQKN